ncbi:hypothetical protein CTheo_2597 [Ceratobasidium theobromae]|uniref:Uncharacterized protein n=1 Tax=Ceratobasidium theobromae TaxID=1582974 RepID=A0A5N5QS51_9AGAM|nr:hypothetical protein CTheo_2597 [Ceratobasidium theobromae]
MVKPSGNNKQALKTVAKALSAAATSLALAADALSQLYETDEDDVSTAGSHCPSLVTNQLGAPVAASTASLIDYDDSEGSDNECMTLARNAIRAESGYQTAYIGALAHIDTRKILKLSIAPQSPPSHTQNNLGFMPKWTGNHTPTDIKDAVSEKSMTDTLDEVRTSHRDTTKTSFQPVPSMDELGDIAHPRNEATHSPPWRPPPKTWANLLRSGAPTAGSSTGGPSRIRPASSMSRNELATTSSIIDVPEQGFKIPFENLKKKWANPTVVQYQTIQQLRTGQDVLLLRDNFKTHIHYAMFIRCMEVLKQRNPVQSSTGIVSALVIVPQQTTGRSLLQCANELLEDFGLPHRALLLPGGGSDILTEAERMRSERIDILISASTSPRVLVNHVNNNPDLVKHFSQLKLIIYASAHELTKQDAFLNFQLNAIKKRMPTRTKCPRQIIVDSAGLDDQVQWFAERTLRPGHVTVYGPEVGDELRGELWDTFLRA